MKKQFFFIATILFFWSAAMAQCPIDPITEGMECTSITVGKRASADGSVMTSHTDDSHRSRTNIMVEPAADHQKGEKQTLYKRVWAKNEPGKMARYEDVPVGEIDMPAHTYQFFNTAYPCVNEKQLAIGESTFGGRAELKSDKGLIDCQRLCMLLLQRCSTAREAIRTAGELLKQYGWIDAGECLTIADKNEVWHLEILGPGKDKVGAVWAAQRVPDEHVAVNANASTIREINLKDKDYFMASDNVYSLAQEMGWWDGKSTFQFAYAYAPSTRTMIACRRREWRVFDLLAPSLHLDPNSENYPFSVKPDSAVTVEKMMSIFRDYYEGTPYDMRKTLTVADKEGKSVISPMANPFMKADEMKLFKINGGWDERGERNIAVHFTVYGTIIQCRSKLPDEVGALCWFALDNVASSIYVPLYANITDLPATYKTDGRETGFSQKAAWWAFNRLGTIAAQRWGDMHIVIDNVWQPLEKEFREGSAQIEQEALRQLRSGDRAGAIKTLTDYSNQCGNRAVDQAWKLGDHIWTVFDGMW
ncbi:MAG: C69 family dipeptidase [Bacteroidales bacterium]|nr:C69 family dipeptidase [Bacteroidales bacterium]